MDSSAGSTAPVMPVLQSISAPSSAVASTSSIFLFLGRAGHADAVLHFACVRARAWFRLFSFHFTKILAPVGTKRVQMVHFWHFGAFQRSEELLGPAVRPRDASCMPAALTDIG